MWFISGHCDRKCSVNLIDVFPPRYIRQTFSRESYGLLVIMSTHSIHENSVRESAAKADVPPIITQLEESTSRTSIPSLEPNIYCLQVDTSAIDPYKLKRKIDFRLLPWLTLLYLMNYLDRGSIGNARVCTLCVPTVLCDISRTLQSPTHSCITWKRVFISQISNILWRSQPFSFPILC
jgi:hypothetical protein